jgi:hypothetical protein
MLRLRLPPGLSLGDPAPDLLGVTPAVAADGLRASGRLDDYIAEDESASTLTEATWSVAMVSSKWPRSRGVQRTTRLGEHGYLRGPYAVALRPARGAEDWDVLPKGPVAGVVDGPPEDPEADHAADSKSDGFQRLSRGTRPW